MKNLIFVVLFLGIVVGGGIWLTSGDSTDTTSSENDSTADAEAADVAETQEEIQKPEISPSGPWPKLVLKEKTFDFGSMLVGQKKSHVFKLHNEGDADLELVEGKATCKCTQFSLANKTVKPGESTELTIEWHGKFVDQSFSHGGPVYSNDPNNSEVNVRVTGIVDDPVQILPANAWVVQSTVGESGAGMRGFLISRVFEETRITSLEPQSPHIQAVAEPIPSENFKDLGVRPGVRSGQYIDVSLKPDAPPGTLHTSLKISIEGVDAPLTVDISAKQQGPVKILAPPGVAWNEEKSGLGLGRFPKDKGHEVYLTLIVDVSGMDTEFQVTKVDATPTFLIAELEDGTDIGPGRRRYKLKVGVPPGIPRSSRTSRNPARLQIATNHPSGQTFSILVSYNAF